MVPSWSRPVRVKASRSKPNMWWSIFTQDGAKTNISSYEINTNMFLEAVRGCTATLLVSLLLSALDILSPHFLINRSTMTIFACCQTVNRPRKCPKMCALWPGGEYWLYFHGQRVCVFSSVKSGLRRPPPHWACVCPRGPDPAFPVFLCLCRECSTDLLAQLLSFILPPSSPSFSLLYLPDPSGLPFGCSSGCPLSSLEWPIAE